MQDIQNIPAPDDNPNTTEEDFNNHAHNYPDVPDEGGRESVEDIPLPPDQKPAATIEEPPAEENSDVERIA